VVFARGVVLQLYSNVSMLKITAQSIRYMQVNRLFDPDDTSVNLNTMAKVAEAMGKKLELRFV